MRPTLDPSRLVVGTAGIAGFVVMTTTMGPLAAESAPETEVDTQPPVADTPVAHPTPGIDDAAPDAGDEPAPPRVIVVEIHRSVAGGEGGGGDPAGASSSAPPGRTSSATAGAVSRPVAVPTAPPRTAAIPPPPPPPPTAPPAQTSGS